MKYRILYTLVVLFFTGCSVEPVDIHEKIASEKLDPFHTKSIDGQVYYWYNDSKVYMTETDDVFVVLKEEDLKYLDSNVQVFNIDEDGHTGAQANILVADAVSENASHYGMRIKASVVNDFDEDIVYCAPYYLLPTGDEIGLSELFLVKLKAPEDYAILKDFANQHKVNIVKKMSRPLWYKLSCSVNSTDNALRMANLAYESGLFAATEAIFINNITLDTDSYSYNDPEYYCQWNISPNETYSINMGNVHNITSGEKDVMVAVIDTGFQLDHPDIDMNSGWDATHRSIGAKLYEYANEKYTYHGTGTAGIIGAKANNNIGIVGVAPNVTIFPISVHMDSTAYRSSHDAIVDAIDYAVARGADVLSNSWSLKSPSEYIKEAVNDALIYGRDGKGSVVVFASGNYSSQESRYPHAQIPDIISVGNSDSNGYRKSTSNYGPDLDLVAPGTLIRTLQPGSSYYYATGTSFSCPHVSAVAALMVSANPNLTQSEIGDILDITATKIDTYDYIVNPGKPNGLWNNQVGYGLVNCYDAVSLAYYYNENNYFNLIEFDYADSQVEIDLKTKDDIAVIWDWETKDITYINATATAPKDTTISHNYGTTGSRRIIIAETVSPGEAAPTSSTALTRFDLTTGSGARNIEIHPVNNALEYVRIIGGSGFVSQQVAVSDLPALESLFLVNLQNAHMSVTDCPELRVFGTSREVWMPTSSGGLPVSPMGSGTVDPNVVGGSPNTSVWPYVPEPVVSPSSLSISGCPSLVTLSLENAGFQTFSFSGLNNLLYLYLSSRLGHIAGASPNSNMSSTRGQYLKNAILTLPPRGSWNKGMVVIRCVSSSVNEYVPLTIASTNRTAIEDYCKENNWALVWESGIN